MSYPPTCLRGIPNETFLTAEGVPTSALFIPPNDVLEISINWEDDADTVNFTLCMMKEDRFQFREGVARLPIKGIIEVQESPILHDPISYNRDTIDNNNYHGNIIYKENLSKEARKMVAGMLALKVTTIIRRQQEESR